MMLQQRTEKSVLARRIREVREELFGQDGGPLLAQVMELPDRTWRNYEVGVTIPATVILGFILVCGVNPRWLLTGEGERYLERVRSGVPDQSVAVTARLDRE
jgi:hypothetical protein